MITLSVKQQHQTKQEYYSPISRLINIADQAQLIKQPKTQHKYEVLRN